MRKIHWQFLFIFAIAILSVFMFNLNPASALWLANERNESYAIQINALGCEFTDYAVQVDLWHLSIAGSYTAMLNNSGDTDVSIRWKEGYGDTIPQENRIIIPANTVKKYRINFSFHLVSRELSYEYVEL